MLGFNIKNASKHFLRPNVSEKMMFSEIYEIFLQKWKIKTPIFTFSHAFKKISQNHHQMVPFCTEINSEMVIKMKRAFCFNNHAKICCQSAGFENRWCNLKG